MFARFGRPPVQLVPLVLNHNLRNTRQIASTFVPLAPTGMELRGGDGPPSCSASTSQGRATGHPGGSTSACPGDRPTSRGRRPDVITTMGGPEVHRRVGLPSRTSEASVDPF